MPFSPCQKLRFDDFCVLDLETTGLMADQCEILEVGILRVRKGLPVMKFETLIRPEQLPVPVPITRITGIRTEMVIQAPTIEQAAPWIWEFIGNDPILGYNISFDLRFLQVHAPSPSLAVHQYLDILPLVRISYPQLSSHSLSTMTKTLNLYQNTHRAIDDCIAAYQLYERCKSLLAPLDDTQIHEKIRNIARKRARHHQKK